MAKVCNVCRKPKPLDQFGQVSLSKDEHLETCLACMAAAKADASPRKDEQTLAYERRLAKFAVEWEKGNRYLSRVLRGETLRPTPAWLASYHHAVNVIRDLWPPRKVTLPRAALAHLKSACQLCGGPDNLHVHHADGDRSNSSAANIITLCADCHRWIHVLLRPSGLWWPSARVRVMRQLLKTARKGRIHAGYNPARLMGRLGYGELWRIIHTRVSMTVDKDLLGSSELMKPSDIPRLSDIPEGY